MKLKKRYKIFIIISSVIASGYLAIAMCYNEPIKYIGVTPLNNRFIQEQIKHDILELETEEEIEKYSLKFTGELLYFTDKQEFRSPSNLSLDRATGAHCVGYSQVCTAICNYAFKQKGMTHVNARHMRGDVKWFGIPLTKILKWSFNKVGMPKWAAFCQDLDYVEVINSNTKEVVSFDPSVYDLLGLQLRHNHL